MVADDDVATEGGVVGEDDLVADGRAKRSAYIAKLMASAYKATGDALVKWHRNRQALAAIARLDDRLL